MLLTLTAFLSCAMMASAEGDKLSDLVASIPEQEEFLIYDIRGDLSSDDVLAAFSGFNVPYKFKSLSGRRFFIVLMKDSSDHKKYASLSFPGASQVDVYPAEHLSNYWEYFGVSGYHDKTVTTLPDENLFLAEYTILEQGFDLDEYKASIRALTHEAIDVDNTMKSRNFHATSMFPFKAFVFMPMPSYTLDRVQLEGSIVYGGPFQTNVVTTPIVNM